MQEDDDLEPRKSVFERVTEKLIAAMEVTQMDCTKPWIGGGFGMASNAKTQVAYKGGNALILGIMGGGEWATFKQWQSMGCKVRKGEKGVPCIKWVVKQTDENSESSRHGLFPNCFTVFSADQVDGYEPPSIPEMPDIVRYDEAEKIISATGAEINMLKQDKAYFSRQKDHIVLPLSSQFTCQKAMYSVMFHELVHWTGMPNRCDRFEVLGETTTEEYAFEELVAEIGAAFLMAECGLSPEPREDHAVYLKAWIARCKKEPRAMMMAAAKAQKAVDFILSHSQIIEQEEAA